MYKCGTDIVNVNRMRESIEKLGDSFISRVFTNNERMYASTKNLGKYESYAARFAGKEAVYKAISPEKYSGAVFTEVEILNDENGKPYVVLHGELAKAAEGLKIDVSLSHEKEYAIAMAVAYEQ